MRARLPLLLLLISAVVIAACAQNEEASNLSPRLESTDDGESSDSDGSTGSAQATDIPPNAPAASIERPTLSIAIDANTENSTTTVEADSSAERPKPVAPPTTSAPTTSPPTTSAPTTPAPTTSPPTTPAPTTSPPTTPAPTTSPPTTPAVDTDRALEVEVIRLTNEARVNAGCDPVVEIPELRTAAWRHSKDMYDQDYTDHVAKDGSSFSTRAENAGYGGFPAGEIIASGQQTPEQAINSWLTSPGHREIMLNCAYTDTGVGHSNKKWTQVFGMSYESLGY